MLKHIVLFAYAKPLDSPETAAVDAAFRELPGRIPEVAGFECGADVSVEGLAKGYDKAYVLAFADADARDVYFHHPIHQEFVAMAKPLLKDVLVFDYIPD